jgi:hypothetical protein
MEHYLLRCCGELLLQVLEPGLVCQKFGVRLLLHWWRLCCSQPIRWRSPVPWRLTLKGGDDARLGEERSEVSTEADDRMRSETAEVALQGGAPLAHELVALDDMPLEDALVGPGRTGTKRPRCAAARRSARATTSRKRLRTRTTSSLPARVVVMR